MSEQITASAIISFCGEWEEEASRFYEQLAQRFEPQGAIFSTMAKECAKHKVSLLLPLSALTGLERRPLFERPHIHFRAVAI